MYALPDLEAWKARRTVASTSQYPSYHRNDLTRPQRGYVLVHTALGVRQSAGADATLVLTNLLAPAACTAERLAPLLYRTGQHAAQT